MNIDNTMQTLEAGFTNPGTTLRRLWVPDEQMEAIKLRRRTSKASHHFLWVLTVGELNVDPAQHATFYGYRAIDCFKKALAWRGVGPKTRGPRTPAQP